MAQIHVNIIFILIYTMQLIKNNKIIKYLAINCGSSHPYNNRDDIRYSEVNKFIKKKDTFYSSNSEIV